MRGSLCHVGTETRAHVSAVRYQHMAVKLVARYHTDMIDVPRADRHENEGTPPTDLAAGLEQKVGVFDRKGAHSRRAG